MYNIFICLLTLILSYSILKGGIFLYKLMIIDDEPFILDGLNSYDWESLNIKVVETCENGYSALSKLESNPVDIILTDIRMPIMDGLMLIEEVFSKYPFIYIIVLSGYDDFNYARKCLKYNVTEYLLKPINTEELFKIFNNLIEKMNKEKQQKVKQSTLEKNALSAVKILRTDFVKKILNFYMDKEDIDEGSTYGELIFESTYYTVCIFKPDNYELLKNISKNEHNIVIFALEKIFEEFCTLKKLGYSWINPDSYECFILCTNEEMQENGQLTIQNMVLELKKTLFSIRGLILTTLSCGIGKPVHEISSIYVSTKQAKAALSSKICEYEVILYNNNMPQIEYSIVNIDIESSSNINLKTKDKYVSTNKNYIIKVAKEYINKNYARSLTLSEVADQVYVSQEYLSCLFREITNINFIDYITKYRIDKAIGLLSDPKYKVFEIGSLVGYENARYFSSVFKKCTGRTPMEFRNNISN